MAQPAERFLLASDRILGWIASALAAVMVVVVSAEVVARYALGSSISFANELARLMFLWVVFLGLPLALSRGRHVGITLLESKLAPRAARWLFRFGCAAGLVLMAITAVKSFDAMVFNWVQRLPTLPVSASLFFMPIPIGATVAAIYLLIMIFGDRRVLIAHDGGSES